MRRETAWMIGVLCLAGCESYPLTDEGRAGCETAVTSVSEGGPTMLPGTACMTCHEHFTAAGTVLATPVSACSAGQPGALVEILDATGRTAITLTTNASGNFFTRAALPSPYTARVTALDGTTHTMSTPQTNGSCAHCHRVPPANGTVGRIATMAAIPDAGVPDAP